MSDKTVEFQKKIDEAANHVKANSTWRHYKGGIYSVKGFAIDTDNGEVRVIYNRIGGPGFDVARGEHWIDFARPLSEWFTDVQAELGGYVPRFKKVTQRPAFFAEDEEEEYNKRS